VSQEIVDSIAEYQLEKHINNLGYVSHIEAIQHQRKSQVLLLIEIDSPETKSIIPGKVFEYLVSERPIIAIGPKDSDFAEIITSTNTGVFFKYDDKERLKETVLNYFDLYLQKNLHVFPVGLQQYSRKSLTERLAKLLTSNF
jgi:glycosyltransferase involved in cell wall biosynthesis